MKGYILISRVLHSLLLTHSSRCLSQGKTFMTGSGLYIIWLGLLKQSRASLVAQTLKNLPAMRETWSDPWVGNIPREKEMATHSSILAWRIHGQWNLAGYSPWGYKELDTAEQLTLTDCNKVSQTRWLKTSRNVLFCKYTGWKSKIHVSAELCSIWDSG